MVLVVVVAAAIIVIVVIGILSAVAAVVPIGAPDIGVSSICPSVLIHESLALEGL